MERKHTEVVLERLTKEMVVCSKWVKDTQEGGYQKKVFSLT